jgi:trigger factor
VLSVSQVENVEIADDRTMRYQATVVTAPHFELPDYSAIPAEIAKQKVTEESVSRWLDQLRNHARHLLADGGAPSRWASRY